MINKNQKTFDIGSREILLTREFDATHDLVFDAWTEPEKIGKWWGPKGFTTTTFEMDFQEGGVWRFIMHGPDGTDYPNRIVYTEIVKPERLVYEHGEAEDKPADFKVTAKFEDLGDSKTRLTMRTIFPTAEARNNATEFGAIEGGNQTLERLTEYLAETSD